MTIINFIVSVDLNQIILILSKIWAFFWEFMKMKKNSKKIVHCKKNIFGGAFKKMEEEFNIETLIEWASRYPEFEEKFIETFDSKELLEVYLKLTINVNNYLETGYDYDKGFFQKYNYETIIRDLGI